MWKEIANGEKWRQRNKYFCQIHVMATIFSRNCSSPGQYRCSKWAIEKFYKWKTCIGRCNVIDPLRWEIDWRRKFLDNILRYALPIKLGRTLESTTYWVLIIGFFILFLCVWLMKFSFIRFMLEMLLKRSCVFARRIS